MPKQYQFLHIPKCAGSYVNRLYGGKLRMQHFQSTPSAEAINFAVIRDPFTRIQSIFAHAKDAYASTSSIRFFTTLDDLAKAFYNPLHTYHAQAVKLLTWNHHKLLHSFKQGSIADRCIDKDGSLIHFAPQYLYVLGHASNCEYLLRFEHLDADLLYYVDAGNLPPPRHAPNGVKVNVSSTESKLLATQTPVVTQLVHDIYSQDIALHKSLSQDSHPRGRWVDPRKSSSTQTNQHDLRSN